MILSCPVELCEVQTYLATDLAKSRVSSRVLRGSGDNPRTQRRWQPRIAVRLTPARSLPRLRCGRTMKWTAAPSRRCPTQRRQIVYARSTTFRAQSSSIDADIAHVRDTVMPALEGIEGDIGLSLVGARPPPPRV